MMTPEDRPWIALTDETPPDGLVVETRIDDGRGVRNEQTLKRGGRLWWVPGGEMYVYYAPTHWRRTEDEQP